MKKESNHTEDWDFYMSNVDNVIGSIAVDLGLINIAPVASKPNMTWVSIFMRNPREDGLISLEENEFLFEIEDNIVNNIVNKHDAIYAGRLTSDGMRHLYFYFDNTDNYEKTITQAMSKYPTYKFDFGTKEDTEWEGYINFLYPLPDQYQIIMNERVIRNLEENGDNLAKERMVDHGIYFETEKDMENYISEIKKQNFEVINTHQDEDGGYSLEVGRVDKVDSHSVNDYVLYLWDLASEYNGDYLGWGCTIEKD